MFRLKYHCISRLLGVVARGGDMGKSRGWSLLPYLVAKDVPALLPTPL